MDKTLLIGASSFIGLYFQTSSIVVKTPALANHIAPIIAFSVISDLHLRSGVSDRGSPYHDRKAERNLRIAIHDLNDVNPHQNAWILDGDLTATGSQADYEDLNKILREKPHPAITLYAMGNHELYSALRNKHGRISMKNFPNGVTRSSCVQRYLKNTKMPALYYDRWIDGYHFIVLGSETPFMNNPRSIDNAYLSKTQLNWLQKKLTGSRKDMPVFVFLHQPIPYTVSGSAWGDIVNASQLKNILSHYPQVILITGHSHRTLKFQLNTVFYRTFTMFNDSSVYNPVDAHHCPMFDSEGLYVEVYPNVVLVKARDFTNHRWIAQYSIPLHWTPHYS